MSRTVALFGHSGNTGKLILPALAAESSIKLKVLHRASSDVSQLPSTVEAVQVDYADVAAVTQALQGVDIVVSLIGGGIVGTSGILSQIPLVDAAKAAGVKLFLPSDLAPSYTKEEEAAVPVVTAKNEVEQHLKAVGLKYIILHTASIAEFGLGFPFIGINVKDNTIDVPGENNENKIEFSSIPYIAAAYAALLTSPTLDSYSGDLNIVEFSGTTQQIAVALEKKHGNATKITVTPAAEVKKAFEQAANTGGALPSTVRYSWSQRGILGGGKVFEFEAKKHTLDEYIQKL